MSTLGRVYKEFFWRPFQAYSVKERVCSHDMDIISFLVIHTCTSGPSTCTLTSRMSSSSREDELTVWMQRLGLQVTRNTVPADMYLHRRLQSTIRYNVATGNTPRSGNRIFVGWDIMRIVKVPFESYVKHLGRHFIEQEVCRLPNHSAPGRKLLRKWKPMRKVMFILMLQYWSDARYKANAFWTRSFPALNVFVSSVIHVRLQC